MLCVGLDPDPQRIDGDVMSFCREIVDATADIVCAFKPQIAYFATLGLEAQLAELIRYIHVSHPGIPVLLDGKRNDVGHTAEQYAEEMFGRYQADATTVNPYLGEDAVAPFLAYEDRGIFVLCRNSNPNSGWLQDYPENDPVYLRVADKAVEWNTRGNVMLVAGATYPEDLKRIRQAAGDMPILVLGVGAQGGDLSVVLRDATDSEGLGLVISTSRAVLYANDPRSAALELADRLR